MIVQVKFDVPDGHRLSSPWHLNFIDVQSSEQALAAARAYISPQDPHNLYPFCLRIVPQ